MAGAPGRVVRVAVEAVADRPERTFSYRLPPPLGGDESPAAGSLLLVPYGNRLALGYLLGETSDAGSAGDPGVELRDVAAVVSDPILRPDLLTLAEEIAAYYRAPVGMTLAAMRPPGIESRLRRAWEVVDRPALLAAAPSLELPEGDPPRIDDRALRSALSTTVRERLRRAGVLRVAHWLAAPETGPRRIRVARRIGSGQAAARAPVQAALLAALDGTEATLSELAERAGLAPSAVLPALQRLAAHGLVDLGWREEVRDPLAHREAAPATEHVLAGEQREALNQLLAIDPGHELWLEGVSAAGKTEVYLAATDRTLRAGLGAIILVPEVSLIPQLADTLATRYGDQVAVLHSGLSDGERHDAWWRVLRDEARVVVGTRMAIFAPVDRVGLIVIDEAHDGAYKSDRTPRYDARWVARRRAMATGARLVLGTATPPAAEIARIRGGLADRARLSERRVGATPGVEVVDMRAELAAGNRSVLSSALADALGSLPAGREQAILLINRRGTATFVLCRDCGESLRCPDCDLPFVYHAAGERLRCHHCGRTADLPERCPRCASRRIRFFGAGTQRVETEVRGRFPRLRVARLDSDAIARRRGFEAVYDAFRGGEVDVLVGTQLAAKGLDLPSVTLVGVVAADVTLNLPDYLAAERTFQLLVQATGRAGRGPLGGRAIVQTYSPDHYAVRAAAALDVDGFADAELLRRRLLGYPPFAVLARLLVADPQRERGLERANEAAAAVAAPGIAVHGPLAAYVPRRAGRWRFQVILRAPDAGARAASLERVPAGVAIDVDPESLL